MPLTLQKIKFTDNFVKDKDAVAAALKAGYKPSNIEDQVKVLLADKDVQILIGLKAIGDEPEVVTKDSLTREINEAIVYAKVFRNPGAMISAIKAKAQIHKFLQEEHNHNHKGSIDHKLSVEKFDVEERVNQLVDERLANAMQ